jgi:hypothetical protein
MRLQGWVDPVVALVVAAFALVLWGAVRGQLRRGGALVVEMAGMAGMVGFTAIALAAGVGGPGPRPLHRGGRLVWLGRMGLRALAGRQGRVAIVRGVVCSTAFDVLRAVGILILPMP